MPYFLPSEYSVVLGVFQHKEPLACSTRQLPLRSPPISFALKGKVMKGFFPTLSNRGCQRVGCDPLQERGHIADILPIRH